MSTLIADEPARPPHGLPEPLPAGERVLWQGAPDRASLARHALHLRKLTIYFGALLALVMATRMASGEPAAHAVAAALWLAPAALGVLGIVALLAWLMVRTTVYTITDQRVVMKVGVVLSITFNLPFKAIESAGLKPYADATGDIPLKLAKDTVIAYVHLWPHARPWHVARPEPMLRSLPDAGQVAALLARALAATAPAGSRALASAPAAGPALEPRPLATAN